MIQSKSKKEEFEEFEQEVYDAVDEAFDKSTEEVAEILKGYAGINELYRKQKNSTK